MKSVQLITYPLGDIKESDLRIVEEDTPPLKENEVLVKNIYCSTDPYMRARMSPPRDKNNRFSTLPVNTPLIGDSIGVVVESKSSKYPVNTYVSHRLGWRDFAVIPDTNDFLKQIDIVGDPEKFCKDYLISYGLVGQTAYHGLVNILKVKQGDVVAVSGATGGVGHMFIQFAKILGATVYGITSNDTKAKIVESLGATPIVIPKGSKFDQVVKGFQSIPEEIDAYLENVGNDYFAAAMNVMKLGSKMCYCGVLKHYNTLVPGPGPNLFPIIYKDISIHGCYLTSIDLDSYFAFIKEHYSSLQHLSTIYDGIEQMPKQFVEHFFNNDNRTGKSLCKI